MLIDYEKKYYNCATLEERACTLILKSYIYFLFHENKFVIFLTQQVQHGLKNTGSIISPQRGTSRKQANSQFQYFVLLIKSEWLALGG